MKYLLLPRTVFSYIFVKHIFYFFLDFINNPLSLSLSLLSLSLLSLQKKPIVQYLRCRQNVISLLLVSRLISFYVYANVAPAKIFYNYYTTHQLCKLSIFKRIFRLGKIIKKKTKHKNRALSIQILSVCGFFFPILGGIAGGRNDLRPAPPIFFFF